MPNISLRDRFNQHNPLWFINCGGASVDTIDFLAKAGVECIFIDCERTAINMESIAPMVRAAHSHGMYAVLRSESLLPENLVRYLDRGIDGIIVPHVETNEHLQTIEEVVNYVGNSVGKDFFKIAQIESIGAVNHIKAISSSHLVDAFLIGPNDLSHSLGLKGDQKSVLLKDTVDQVIAVLNQQNRLWGIPSNPESTPKFVHQGAKFFYGTVENLLKSGYSNFCHLIN